MIFLRIFAVAKFINLKNQYIMEINITEENFKQVLADNPVVMIDFGATWCGPCKALAPIVEEIANEYEGKAAICKADVEECSTIAAQFRIRNVPTVLFFKNGEPKDKSVGLVQKSTLTEKIDALL
jgi:thioredoxin 1